MHINPGLIDGAKMILAYGTGATAALYGARLAWETLKTSGAASLAARSVIATGAVLSFFQLLPHPPVGVSEVHLILGSTLFLMLGAAPAAIGLTLGLLLQGLFFAPFDLPQYGANLTTLLVPLFAMVALSRRIIAPGTAYVDLSYGQVARLSATYQGGIVAWVAFWAFYGQGFAAWESVATFGAAYMLVVLIEPLVDLAVLAAAKSLSGLEKTGLVTPRLYG
ncbi:energy-coupling factor ABC transporter permease [Maritimibacter fusiformis]|uniref:Cobalt transporter n=1 Tax=Maritimibacter fusiformis TaxID=2603819 RepID=A0A5D0RGM1_9RHOB|nr:energy-coupling factor ABC transporter permease [Maritimibacter fusiformis]TYB80041.1 cobalt transporter [Maritimibacter fusiformis]